APLSSSPNEVATSPPRTTRPSSVSTTTAWSPSVCPGAGSRRIPGSGSGDLHALRSRLTGQLVLLGDPEWDDARRAWNLTVDQRPSAIALVESVEDVVKVVEFAGEH